MPQSHFKAEASIHPTSIVHSRTSLGQGVSIGPYCMVDENVVLEDGVKLISHVCIAGKTRIGAGTTVFPFASIGHAPQDLKYHGEESTLIIGQNNVIREYVTINPGTEHGGMKTVIGDNCLLMVGVHVAHDCIVGNNVIMANNATLAGHIVVGDHAVLGGLCAVHQFVRIGAHSMVGGGAMVNADVIPYGTVYGNRANLEGINIVGMRRRAFDKKVIEELIAGVKELLFIHNDANISEKINIAAAKYGHNNCMMEIIEFFKNGGGKAICMPKDYNRSQE